MIGVRPVLLSGLAASLAAVIALELGSGAATGAAGESRAARARPAAAAPDAAELPAPDETPRQVALILQRPLFAPGRRPGARANPAAEASTPSLPRLAGTLVTTDAKRAIFAGPQSGLPLVVGEGGRVGPWTVQAIAAGQVTVAGPEGRRTVHPSFDLAPATPATPLNGARPAPFPASAPTPSPLAGQGTRRPQ